MKKEFASQEIPRYLTVIIKHGSTKDKSLCPIIHKDIRMQTGLDIDAVQSLKNAQ